MNLESDVLACINKRLESPVASLNTLAADSNNIIGSHPLTLNTMNEFNTYFKTYTPISETIINDMIVHAKNVIESSAVYDSSKLITISNDEVLLMKNK